MNEWITVHNEVKQRSSVTQQFPVPHPTLNSTHVSCDWLQSLTWRTEFLELVVDQREVEDDGAVRVCWVLEDVTFPHFLTFILCNLKQYKSQSQDHSSMQSIISMSTVTYKQITGQIILLSKKKLMIYNEDWAYTRG